MSKLDLHAAIMEQIMIQVPQWKKKR